MLIFLKKGVVLRDNKISLRSYVSFKYYAIITYKISYQSDLNINLHILL